MQFAIITNDSRKWHVVVTNDSFFTSAWLDPSFFFSKKMHATQTQFGYHPWFGLVIDTRCQLQVVQLVHNRTQSVYSKHQDVFGHHQIQLQQTRGAVKETKTNKKKQEVLFLYCLKVLSAISTMGTYKSWGWKKYIGNKASQTCWPCQ